MPTQNVNLTPELDEFVKTQVSSGYYNNASEVHRAALANLARLEEERQLRLEQLKQEIAIGLKDLDEGRFTEFASHDDLDKHLDTLCDKVAAEGKAE
jgi:antitoxin ParD1/3/4